MRARLPAAGAARPRRRDTPDGALGYTGQRSYKLGRLDPATGKVDVVKPPTDRAVPYGLVVARDGAASHPYGIAMTPDGGVWYSESGVTPNTVVRNMVATPEGRLYLARSGVNKVAIVKP